MRRRLLIGLGVVLFLAISVLLARFLSLPNAERDDLVSLLQAQADGNAPAMLSQLSGCNTSPRCVAQVHANALELRRKGAVKILTLTPAHAYSLTSATGTTRVAWTVLGTLPVVQCVRVRRSGNALSGFTLALLSIGPRIEGEADC